MTKCCSICVADEVQLTNKDPRWVGAWWLGFLVAASLVAVSAVPYFFFPREMPKEVGEVLRVALVALRSNTPFLKACCELCFGLISGMW